MARLRKDGALPLGTKACPKDGAVLHYKNIGGMTTYVTVGKNTYYMTRCSKCLMEYSVYRGRE